MWLEVCTVAGSAALMLSCSAQVPEPPGNEAPPASPSREEEIAPAPAVDLRAVAFDYAGKVALPLDRTEVRLSPSSPRSALPARQSITRGASAPPIAAEATVAASAGVLVTALAQPGELSIWRIDGNASTQEAKFDPVPKGATCHWVSLAASGNLVVAGVPASDPGGAEPSILRTYRRDPAGTWSESRLVTKAGGYFGFSVALDGNVLAVGAPETSPAGSVFVYTWQRDGWSLQQKLDGNRPGDRFGWSVAVRGGRLIVGAPGEDSIAGDATSVAGWGSGAAYVFVRDAAGSWSRTASLKAPGIAPRATPSCNGMGCMEMPRAIEELGAAVAISDEGVLVGAPGGGSPIWASPMAPGRGAAYLFTRDTSSPFGWKVSKTFEAPPELRRYGSSVAIDGDMLAIGAASHEPRPGALPTTVESSSVAVFTRGVKGDWVADVSVTAPVAPGASQARFALAGGRMATSGFTRQRDGSVVDVLDLGVGR